MAEEDFYYWTFLSCFVFVIISLLCYLGVYIFSKINKRFKEYYEYNYERIDFIISRIFIYPFLASVVVFMILDLFGVIEYAWFIP